MANSSNDKRDAIELCIALKKIPRVYSQLKNVWGYPEFFDTVDGLLLMERGREDRAGFSDGVYKEIDALKRVFMKFPEEVMSPYLSEVERNRVKKIIDETHTRLAFSTGDRR
jgi:hypothetical protein